MRDQDLEPKFSWTLIFFVTGISFLCFCGAMKILNDSYPSSFLWVGMVSLILGGISAIGSRILKEEEAQETE